MEIEGGRRRLLMSAIAGAQADSVFRRRGKQCARRRITGPVRDTSTGRAVGNYPLVRTGGGGR